MRSLQLAQVSEVEAISTNAVGIAFIVLGVVVAAGVAVWICYCNAVAHTCGDS